MNARMTRADRKKAAQYQANCAESAWLTSRMGDIAPRVREAIGASAAVLPADAALPTVIVGVISSDGIYKPGWVAVSSRQSRLEMLKTLAHELAHFWEGYNEVDASIPYLNRPEEIRAFAAEELVSEDALVTREEVKK